MKDISVLVKKVEKYKWFKQNVSSLEDMQSIVGGYIDRVSLPLGIDLWVNDEGAINGEELNLIILWGKDSNEHQHIFGSVFLASHDENNGETISLSNDQLHWFTKYLKQVMLLSGKFVYAIDLRKVGDNL